jgi:hypothetical protein
MQHKLPKNFIETKKKKSIQEKISTSIKILLE